MSAHGGRPVGRSCALALLVAATTLFLQILVHRMVSAKLLNNFAFLVISLTMLGFAFSGVLLSRFRNRALENWEDVQAGSAAGLVVSILAVSVYFYHAPAGIQFTPVLSLFLREALEWMPAVLGFSIPFAFAGFMLGAMLADPTLPTRRVYGFDLLGSAAGAFVVIPAVRHLGVERALLLSCGVLLIGTILLVRPRRRATHVVLASATAVLVAAAWGQATLFQMRPRVGSMLALREAIGPPYGLEHLQWDPIARIEVTRIPPPSPESMPYPALIGDDAAFLDTFRRMLTQNDYAFTYMVDWDGQPDSLAGIEQTIYAAAYVASSIESPRVLVIGVGGGFDILAALRCGVRKVTGVEINHATVDIITRVYRDYCRSWVEDPRVRLVEDEGRRYLDTTHELYDIIQLSGVDSYSGTPGAAHVFSESYLYTAEAFDLYLTRLTDDGILNMMRAEYTPPREMLRAMVTAIGALRRAGVDRPADHILAVSARAGNFTALLVKRSPFTEAERNRVAFWAAKSPRLVLAASPEINGRMENAYQALLEQGRPERERSFVRAYPFDISAVDDDRPFFFRHSAWSHLLSRDPLLRGSYPQLEVTLVLLTAAVGLAVALCVYLPLRLLVGRGKEVHKRRRYAVFFSAIGLGYFGIEIALLQKFGLFLGHPNYALSVVLAALLMATGVGSFLAEATVRRLGGLRFASYALAGIVLLEYLVALPALPRLVGLSFALRVALAVLLIAPIGLLLGLYMPRGLDRLKAAGPALVPWAWGINGIFSVLAPVLAIAVSATWGMNALLLATIPLYLVAGWTLPSAPDGPPATRGNGGTFVTLNDLVP